MVHSNSKPPVSLKQQLYDHCKMELQLRMKRILQSIRSVEDSMQQEGKSTAGDKHNTARANMQLERERLGQSLRQLEQMSAQLDRIPLEEISGPVRAGSLIHTTSGRFYLSIAVDAKVVGDKTFYMVGLSSPLARVVIGKSVGDVYSLNGRQSTILELL